MREGRGVISDVIAALDYAVAQSRGAQHPRHQPLGRRGGHQLLQHRSADAGGQARRRCRHRRRHRGRQPRAERARAAAVRRHHRAGQRALGPDRRRLEPPGHAQPPRRRRRRLTARAGPRRSTTRPSPTSSRPGTGIVSLSDPASTLLSHQGRVPGGRQGRHRLQAVSVPDRHQHGGAGRQRHRRADAPGQPDADAEPRQGDPAVHRAAAARRSTR